MSSYNITINILANTSRAERGISRTTSLMDTFTRSARIAAGVLMRDLVRGLASGAVESLRLGATVDTLKKSFDMMSEAAGGNVSSLEDLRRATRGMVADVDLLRQANQALALGLPTDRLDELFDSAIRLGKAMGLDATQAVESLTIGIGRQSRLVLDNLGVIVKAEDAYAWYAKQLGKTVEALTEAEKREGWMAYAIEQVTRKARVLGDNISAAERKQEQWTAAVKNATTAVGRFLSPLASVTPILEDMTPALSMIAVQVLPSLISKIAATSTATVAWGAVTAATSQLVTASILGIPIIGWAAAAVAAITGIILVLRKWRDAADEVAKAERDKARAQGESQRALEALDEATEKYNLTLEAQKAAEENVEAQLERVRQARKALEQAKRQEAEASEALRRAEEELAAAQEQEARAQQNMASVLAYLRGETDELVLSTEDLTWTSEEARMRYAELTSELQDLQAQFNETSAAMAGFQDQMGDLNLEQARIRLEQMKLRDAYEDGTITEEEYRKRNEELEDKLRDLGIKQQELRINIMETQDALDEQKKSIDEVRENIDVLTSADDDLEEKQAAVADKISAARDAHQRYKEAIDNTTEAEKQLKDAIDDLHEALGDLIEKQNEAADAHEALAQAELEAKVKAELLKEAIDKLESKKIEVETRYKYSYLYIPPEYRGEKAEFGGGWQRGGSGIVTKPTWFLAGEAGPEFFSFKPISASGGGLEGTGGVTLVFEEGAIQFIEPRLDTVMDRRALVRELVEMLGKEMMMQR